MAATNYLEEAPTVFSELGRRFGEQAARADGVLESEAGRQATDVLGHLALLVNTDNITAGQLWSALAAERGSVSACNMLANLARASQGQLIANKTTPIKAATPNASGAK